MSFFRKKWASRYKFFFSKQFRTLSPEVQRDLRKFSLLYSAGAFTFLFALETLAAFGVSKLLGLSFLPPVVVYDDVQSEEEETNLIQQQSSLNEQSQNKVYLDEMDNIYLDEMYWKLLVTNVNPPRLMYLQNSIIHPVREYFLIILSSCMLAEHWASRATKQFLTNYLIQNVVLEPNDLRKALANHVAHKTCWWLILSMVALALPYYQVRSWIARRQLLHGNDLASQLKRERALKIIEKDIDLDEEIQLIEQRKEKEALALFENQQLILQLLPQTEQELRLHIEPKLKQRQDLTQLDEIQLLTELEYCAALREKILEKYAIEDLVDKEEYTPEENNKLIRMQTEILIFAEYMEDISKILKDTPIELPFSRIQKYSIHPNYTNDPIAQLLIAQLKSAFHIEALNNMIVKIESDKSLIENYTYSPTLEHTVASYYLAATLYWPAVFILRIWNTPVIYLSKFLAKYPASVIVNQMIAKNLFKIRY